MAPKTPSLFLCLALIMAFSLTGCQAEASALSDEQVMQVTVNILTAINEENHQSFIKDFSSGMAAAFAEEQFVELRDMLQESSGNYVSCQKPTFFNNSVYTVYRLICVFDREDVVVSVVFQIGGDKVEGLYFDSPNLRQPNP